MSLFSGSSLRVEYVHGVHVARVRLPAPRLMIGSAHLSSFPSKPIPKKRLGLRSLVWFWGLNILLLIFPAWFWFSVILRLGLGTDYFFDVFFANLGHTFVGNTLLVIGVIFFPGLAIGVNGMFYIQSHRYLALTLSVLSALLLIGGFFAAVRRG